MATAAEWIEGARLRTLPLAFAPVIAGTGAAHFADPQLWLHGPGLPAIVRAVLAALVSVLLQIGVNYANDYSDGVKGTDDVRVGPLRLTASGAASPAAVKRAAFLSFGAAAVFGLALTLASGHWWLILAGIVCVLAAWGYTGGSKPYGYMGLGDVMVFIFFGLVATLGTTYTQVDRINAVSWAGAVSVGLFSMCVLMANNVRDIPTDREVGKMTMAVRLGEKRARLAFVVMAIIGVVLPAALFPQLGAWVGLPMLTAVLFVSPARVMLADHSLDRRSLIPVLKTTGIAALIFSVLYAVAAVLAAR